MNLERGFRRLVLIISLAGVAVGLAVTVYDTYETLRYVSQGRVAERCMNDAMTRRPTVEDFKRLPDRWKPRESPADKLDADGRLKVWVSAVQGYWMDSCLAWGERIPALPTHLKSAMRLWNGAYFLPLWTQIDYWSYSLALFPLAWGVILSASFGAIPWGVFYLVRWIAHGFKG